MDKDRRFLMIKGGRKMSVFIKDGKIEVERINCMSSAREIIQKSMKIKDLTSQQIKESFKEILNEEKS